MSIILTGFMGTGKSAVGRQLAKRLGWQFVDVDQLIETSAKMPITGIFEQRGEAVFRRLERRHINRLRHGIQQVIATGGGAFVDPQNRRWLRATGLVICLTAKPRIIVNRIRHRLSSRPLLSGSPGSNVVSRIRALMIQRVSAYSQADVTIDTSHLSVEEVVDHLWKQLSPVLCKSWQYFLRHAGELSKRYGGRYVVVVENRVVASGETQLEAYQNASPSLSNEREAGIYYIPLPEESVTALFAIS